VPGIYKSQRWLFYAIEVESILVNETLPSDAYDTTRMGVIIRDSEELFAKNRSECFKLIHEIGTQLEEHLRLVDPDEAYVPPSSLTRYVAIDGTRDIIEGQTHARIFAGAFAVKGEFDGRVDVTNIDHGCAFGIVSLPYKIVTSGDDYITESAGVITNLLMLLAEIYIAIRYAQSDVDVILLDRPLCGTLAHTRTKLPPNSIFHEYGRKSLNKPKDLDQLFELFETVTRRLFEETHPDPLRFGDRYVSSDELMFVCRIGMEYLFSLCSERKIDLVGVIKTTNDCSFLRFLITHFALNGMDTTKIRKIFAQLDDCKVLEHWIAPYQKLVCTREYDTALMTLMVDESGKVKELGGGGIAPPKRIVRSYMSFGLPLKGGFVFAVERLVLAGENPPLLDLPNGKTIYLLPVKGNSKQDRIFGLLKGMCTGAFPEALWYPLPLALAHRFAKSNFDYIRPRLKATSRVYGQEIGYGDLKRGFT